MNKLLKKALSKRAQPNYERMRCEDPYPVLESLRRRWVSAIKGLPEGVTYYRTRRATVQEETYIHLNAGRKFDLRESEVFFAVTELKVQGSIVKKYELLPIISPGNRIKLSGTNYTLLRSLQDRVLALNSGNTIFLRLQQDRKKINARNGFAYDHTNKTKIAATVPIIEIIKGRTTHTMLYSIVKYGVEGTFEQMGFTDEEVNGRFYYKADAVPVTINGIEPVIYTSTIEGIDYGYLHYYSRPKDHVVEFKARSVVVNWFSILETYPEYLGDYSAACDRYSYLRSLGKTLYPKSPEVKRVEELKSHFVHLDQYLDDITISHLRMHFDEPEIHAIEDIYALCAYITVEYDIFLEKERRSDSVGNKLYDMSPAFNYLTVMIYKFLRDLRRMGGKKKLTHQDVVKLARQVNWQTFNLRKKGDCVRICNSPMDSRWRMVNVVNDNPGTRQKRRGSHPLPTATMALYGDAHGIKKSAPTMTNRLNMYAKTTNGCVIISDEDRAIINETQERLNAPLD